MEGDRYSSLNLGELPFKKFPIICILLAQSDSIAFVVASITYGEC